MVQKTPFLLPVRWSSSLYPFCNAVKSLIDLGAAVEDLQPCSLQNVGGVARLHNQAATIARYRCVLRLKPLALACVTNGRICTLLVSPWPCVCAAQYAPTASKRSR